jgi:hypothetical protein
MGEFLVKGKGERSDEDHNKVRKRKENWKGPAAAFSAPTTYRL